MTPAPASSSRIRSDAARSRAARAWRRCSTSDSICATDSAGSAPPASSSVSGSPAGRLLSHASASQPSSPTTDASDLSSAASRGAASGASTFAALSSRASPEITASASGVLKSSSIAATKRSVALPAANCAAGVTPRSDRYQRSSRPSASFRFSSL